MIDPFHLQTYGETTVNYNRDIEIFPVLKRMLERILGESPYASPTDMGVNMVGFILQMIKKLLSKLLNKKSSAATIKLFLILKPKKLAKLLSRKLSCS